MDSPTKTQERTHEIVRHICAEHPDAFAFWIMVCDASMTIDHIADNDELDRSAAVEAIKALLIDLPQNEFFIAHRAALLPVMSNALSAWEFSNKPAAPKVKAFDVYTEIPATLAFIIGGRALVDRHIPELRAIHLLNMQEDDAKDGGKK